MDFGKKGDAKKAMKLMWKDGITLKQAWKKVKSGKKSESPKRKGSESPKRKRAQKLAKKAMKLHHKEGISLKQAWKKVQKKNKFGDGVCIEGYEPNPNYTGAGADRRRPCLKKCDLFYMRDPSGKCRKMTMVNSPPVPLGYEIGPSGRKRKICPAGWYREPSTGRCRMIRTAPKQAYPSLIAPAPSAVAVPWAGATLMDFGKNNWNLPNVSKKSAPHRPVRGVGIPWKQKLWFGKGKKCGFGSCQTCNIMNF